MLNSKSNGVMLITGIVAFILFFVAQAVQGSTGDGIEGTIAWAAEDNDYETIIMPLRMIGGIIMIAFTAGFISWVRTLDETSGFLQFGKLIAILSLILVWVGTLAQVGGFESSSENTDAAYALIRMSRMGMWVGIQMFMLSFFVVGATAYFRKLGTPVLNGILGIFGFLGFAGTFVMWIFWVVGFPLCLIVLAITGVQKIRNS
tara:strand:- start:36 stop:644 length:609 start_codon:yes stop_codon:yes gene_type:complete